MKKRCHQHIPTREEAEIVLELWASKCFDTHDIARYTRLHEAVVSRLIHAARDTVRLMAAGRV